MRRIMAVAVPTSVIAFAVLVTVVRRNYRPPLPDKPQVSTTAQELWQAYQDNEVGAERRFKGKYVEVIGRVNNLKNAENGYAHVLLSVDRGSTVANLMPGYCVACVFEPQRADALTPCRAGDTITVWGLCHGRAEGKNIVLERCSLHSRSPRP
jgi:hypothetical protein